MKAHTLTAFLAAFYLSAAAAQTTEDYVNAIRNKVRSNIVAPPLTAIVHIEVLPGGKIKSANLTQSSGSIDYDKAVMEAIIKSQPLPLPSDIKERAKFRNIDLQFRP